MALAIFGVKPKVARAILGVKLFTKQSEGSSSKGFLSFCEHKKDGQNMRQGIE